MRSPSVLIVDDEQDVLTVLKKRLDAEGWQVQTANGGAQALLLARTKKPDLVILDVMMPGMDGGQVAAELKKDPQTHEIPIMFLSALYPKTEENRLGHLRGGHVMFAKPYDMDELLSVAHQLV